MVMLRHHDQRSIDHSRTNRPKVKYTVLSLLNNILKINGPFAPSSCSTYSIAPQVLLNVLAIQREVIVIKHVIPLRYLILIQDLKRAY